jgi:outer membrane protein assembly factor BamB
MMTRLTPDRGMPRIAVTLWILGTSLSALAADWPQWGGTNSRNMVSAEKALPESFVPDKEGTTGQANGHENAKGIKWVVKVGAFAYGNPTVAGGRVFVGTDAQTLSADPRFKALKGGLIKCFDEANGTLLWQLPIPERLTRLPAGAHFTQQFLGICSSPTVDGDRVYVVTEAGDVLCLDVKGQSDGNAGPFTDEAHYMAGPDKPPVKLNDKDGDIIWRFDPIDELGVCPHDVASCSVLIVGDMLYAATSNGVEKSHEKVVSPLAPGLIVLDKRTGVLLATDDEKIGTRQWHTQWGSPSSGTVGDKTLVFFPGADGVCYAFEALTAAPKTPVHLQKVWSYDCCPAECKYRDGKLIPYYDGDKRKANSPNKNDGSYIGPSEIIGTPVFHEGRVYVAIGQDPSHGRGKGMLYCIDASKTGDITATGALWKYGDIDRSLSTVAVADGLVYVTDVAGRLHCVDAQTGQRCWVHETNEEAWGSPLVADGKVYFGTSKSFYIMAAGRQARVLNSVRMTAPVYSTPVAAKGVLYIASNRYLWATHVTP